MTDTDVNVRRPRPTWHAILQTLLLFSLFYAAVLRFIEPHLIHQRFLAGSLEFSRSWAHFVTLLGRGGGLADYISGHLFQYFVWDSVGALSITLTVLGITIATGALLRARPASVWYAARFLPAILLLALWSQYDNPLRFAVGLLVALAGAVLYVRTAPERRWVRLGLYLVAGALVCCAAGWPWGAAHAVFCGVVELRSRRLLHGIVALVAGVITGATAAWSLLASGVRPVWDQTLFVANGRLMLPAVAVVLAVLYLMIALFRGPVVSGGEEAAATDRGQSRADRRQEARRQRKRQSAKPSVISLAVAVCRKPPVWWTLQTAVVLAVAAAMATPLFDSETRLWLELKYDFRNHRWPELLSAARQLPDRKHYPFVNHDVNQALYHTGRLPYEMFSYPQHPDSLTLLPIKDSLGYSEELYGRLADTYYELGRLNDSEHWSHELLQLEGDDPWTLRRLVKINTIKNPAAASVFLNYMVDLHNDPEAECWGCAWLRRMEDDPQLADDDELRRLHSLWQVEDTVPRSRTTEGDLLALLACNPHNRMAFEYLMAHYLLTCQVDRVVANFHRLDDFDYCGIPRYWEEAALLQEQMSDKPVDLCGRQISPETTRRFQEIGRKLKGLPATDAGRQARLNMLGSEYADSYFFYFARFVIHAARENR